MVRLLGEATGANGLLRTESKADVPEMPMPSSRCPGIVGEAQMGCQAALPGAVILWKCTIRIRQLGAGHICVGLRVDRLAEALLERLAAG